MHALMGALALVALAQAGESSGNSQALENLTVRGTLDLQGSMSNSTGNVTISDTVSVSGTIINSTATIQDANTTRFLFTTATGSMYTGEAANSGVLYDHTFGTSVAKNTRGRGVMLFCNQGPSAACTKQASVDYDGYIVSKTPHTLTSVYPNALLTAIVMGGHKISEAFTVTSFSMYVSVASSATGAANTIWTVSDGTNTCTATFACDTSTNTTGVKTVAGVNGAGTGCVFAANADLTVAVTTQGCGTAATVKNADVIGIWQ